MNEMLSFPNPYWLLNQLKDKQTEFVVVLVSSSTNDSAIKLVHQFFNKNNINIGITNTLSDKHTTEIFISETTQDAWKIFKRLLVLTLNINTDVFVLPISGRKKKLLVCDMDSTIVLTETLDDIAASIGIGKQVREITLRAMQGKLDFHKALNERISLLKGISEKLFDEVANNVKFNPGAEELIQLAQKNGMRTVLVSGGFEPIVNVVAAKMGFDRYVCNKAEISSGKLTGNVLEPVIDAGAKLKVLQEEIKQLAILPEQTCAVGDGANDLPMLQAAGVGVGYMGKMLVRAGTPYQINSSSLVSILLMMGIAVY